MLKYILYIQFEKFPILNKNYLFENWGALLAAFKPYFFLSFILASLVKNPAFFKSPLNSASAFNKALDIPCLIAPACPVNPPPSTFTITSYLFSLLVKTNGFLTSLINVS